MERSEWISQELTDELAETAATLTRLGVTLAGLPVAMLPSEQRRRVRQVTDEVFRFGAVIPRTVTRMLQEGDEERRVKAQREDLGSRLRRERRGQEKEARSAARYGSDAAEPEHTQAEEAPLRGEEEATAEVEEELQDAWNDPPLEPGELPPDEEE
ncbi:MAG: hypothetical protein M3220_06300 [Chloroflexota bacterium]|nr:hypothetical protein [Chloroflexota bacterium]